MRKSCSNKHREHKDRFYRAHDDFELRYPTWRKGTSIVGIAVAIGMQLIATYAPDYDIVRTMIVIYITAGMIVIFLLDLLATTRWRLVVCGETISIYRSFGDSEHPTVILASAITDCKSPKDKPFDYNFYAGEKKLFHIDSSIDMEHFERYLRDFGIYFLPRTKPFGGRQ